MSYEVAILANGRMPEGAALKAMFEANTLIACDGAVLKARKLGREPDFTVGDGDSAPSGENLLKIAEQNSNDLEKAFRFMRSHFPEARNVAIVGADGLREDHFLGNLFRLTDFAAEIPDVTMITAYGRFDVVRDRRTLQSPLSGDVSIFAPTNGTHAESTGLEWPLDGVDLSQLWRGTLNRTTTESFSIETDHPIIVYRHERTNA